MVEPLYHIWYWVLLV